MNFGTAVANVLIDLGNRTGPTITARVKRHMQRAQQDFESGKTPPKFLLVEDSPLVLLAGTSSLALPADFWRMETRPYFVANGATTPTFLSPKIDMQTAREAQSTVPRAPSVFVLRQSTIDFITPVDVDYNLVWSYYKHAEPLAGDNDTNEWLSETGTQSDWLLGEAGYRTALGTSSADIITQFDKMRTQGRAGVFGETVALEDNSGPIIMGANL